MREQAAIVAKLRVCASCEWIFKINNVMEDCPRCGFGSYGARYAYGDKAYTYALSQKPWFEKKMNTYIAQLDSEIKQSRIDGHGILSFLKEKPNGILPTA